MTLTFLVAAAGAAHGQDPLHVRIDQLVDASQFGPPAPPAGDAEFVRRASLALTGTIPSSSATRAFLDAPPLPDKRASLVDQLLKTPAFARHLATTFDVMLMERRPDQSVPGAEWRKYLESSFVQNKPLDQLARELLSSDGTDAALRPAAKFVLDRAVEPNLLTRDVGRLFFGRDLQCAQCHDHPLIDSYRQAEYYGLYAFFSRSAVFTDEKTKVNTIADRAEGEVTFTSVFKKTVTHTTKPLVIGGEPVADPAGGGGKPGEEYTVKPAKGVRQVPAYSRRLQLAKEAIGGAGKAAFDRNMANRLWAHMMGRGLVEPLDLHHAQNPPSHPQLLDVLAAELAAMKYDTRAFLRELALTKAFARSFELPVSVTQQAATAQAQIAALEAGHQKLAASVAPSHEAASKADEALGAAAKDRAAIAGELAKANAALAAVQKTVDPLVAAMTAAQQQVAGKQDAANAVNEALAKTQDAAKKLPNDKDLADVAAKLQTKVTQLGTELAVLKSAHDAAAAQAKAASEKLAAPQLVVNEWAAKLAAADQRVEAARKQHAVAFATWTAHEQAASVAQQQLAAARQLADYGKVTASAEAARLAAEKLTVELTAGRAALAAHTTALPVKQAELTAAETVSTELAKQLAVIQQQVAAKRPVVEAVVEAAVKTEIARQKLADQTDLAQAAAKLKALADPLSAELAQLQLMLAARETAVKDAMIKLAAAQSAKQSVATELAALQQRLPALEAQIKSSLDKSAADRAAAVAAFDKLPALWTQQFASSAMTPLTPEQLAWSTMQAVGLIDQTRAASEAEVNQKTPLTDAIKADPAQMAARAAQIDQLVYDKLKGHEAAFVRLFGVGAGESQDTFFATVDQALFVANDGLVKSWLAPAGNNLSDRLNKAADPKVMAEDLYVSVLSRRPSDAEAAEVARYVAARPNERIACVQELAWGLLASAEFRFRH